MGARSAHTGRSPRVQIAEHEFASKRALGSGGHDESRTEYNLTEPAGRSQFLAAQPERCHESRIVRAERRVRRCLPDSRLVRLIDDQRGRKLRIEHQNHYNTLTASIQALPGLTRGSVDPTEWRPYGDPSIGRVLPSRSQVAVHPQMRSGDPLDVCTTHTALIEVVRDGAAAWNTAIRNSKFNRGFTRDVFLFHTRCDDSRDGIDVRVSVVPDGRLQDYCALSSSGGVAACARTNKRAQDAGTAPEVKGTEVFIERQYAPKSGGTYTTAQLRTVLRELGHFLGLGDYGVCASESFHSVMAAQPCRSEVIVDDVDLVDLHDLYHPGARTGMYFRRGDLISGDVNSWTLVTGDAAEDLNGKRVSNAHSYVVFRHELDWRPLPELVGEFGRGSGIARPDVELFTKISNPTSVSQIRGRPFVVAGVTRGDIRTGAAQHMGEHSLQSLDLVGVSGGSKDWTLGEIAIVHGPPTAPLNVRASAADGAVFVMWDPVRGATDYDVFWDDEEINDPPAGSVNPVGHIGVRNVPAGSSGPCGVIVRISKGIANGTTYSFRVRANQSASSIGRCTVPVMMAGAITSTNRWRYQHARRTAGVARSRGDLPSAD